MTGIICLRPGLKKGCDGGKYEGAQKNQCFDRARFKT